MEIRNILVIRLSSLGDIILTQPVIMNLKRHYPQAEIHYLTKPVFQDVVKSFPEDINIILWDNDLKSLIKLYNLHFDLLIDLHNKPNTALIRLFCQAKRKVVYDKKHFLRQQIVNKKTSETISSTLDLYYSVLEKLGIKPIKAYPQIKADNSAKRLLQDNAISPGKFVLIFPGATSYTKRWSLKNFAALIDLISPDNKVVIAGSNSEMELAEELRKLSNSPITDLTGRTTLPELISLVSLAKTVISNDSGPAHLAAALQKPQVTIFGATSPKLGFAPLNDYGIIISKNLLCSPCSLHGSDSCPLGHFNCMKQITPQDVYQSIRTI